MVLLLALFFVQENTRTKSVRPPVPQFLRMDNKQEIANHPYFCSECR